MIFEFVLLCFFFFKQKTAYEMRISDWSSDVCSSDLRRAPVRIAPVALPVAPILAILLPRIAQVAAFAADIVPVAVAHRLTHVEIGRASCRERVCQYV